jgi:hypothetical protein
MVIQVDELVIWAHSNWLNTVAVTQVIYVDYHPGMVMYRLYLFFNM